ncbi:hypothetical protein OV079_29340 [Nannocystis pusilla]|uniref:Uncharacterized protein n=1 Tax=Nannocystis pusilla TaxID=889268 RepID=A0A9X3J0E9_9BACT|nr:hypothetical protein [Nannocystis pusilla]MCY1009599.1 hypothetical protein [Nannocystis pusilla]
MNGGDVHIGSGTAFIAITRSPSCIDDRLDLVLFVPAPAEARPTPRSTSCETSFSIMHLSRGTFTH